MIREGEYPVRASEESNFGGRDVCSEDLSGGVNSVSLSDDTPSAFKKETGRNGLRPETQQANCDSAVTMLWGKINDIGGLIEALEDVLGCEDIPEGDDAGIQPTKTIAEAMVQMGLELNNHIENLNNIILKCRNEVGTYKLFRTTTGGNDER